MFALLYSSVIFSFCKIKRGKYLVYVKDNYKSTYDVMDTFPIVSQWHEIGAFKLYDFAVIIFYIQWIWFLNQHKVKSIKPNNNQKERLYSLRILVWLNAGLINRLWAACVAPSCKRMPLPRTFFINLWKQNCSYCNWEYYVKI